MITAGRLKAMRVGDTMGMRAASRHVSLNRWYNPPVPGDHNNVRSRYEILASTGRRPHSVRSLSTILHAPGRAAGALLRPGTAAGPDRPDDIRAIQWILCRSNREEAPVPFPARYTGLVVRDCRVQPRLQVLPELGYEQVA